MQRRRVREGKGDRDDEHRHGYGRGSRQCVSKANVVKRRADKGRLMFIFSFDLISLNITAKVFQQSIIHRPRRNRPHPRVEHEERPAQVLRDVRDRGAVAEAALARIHLAENLRHDEPPRADDLELEPPGLQIHEHRPAVARLHTQRGVLGPQIPVHVVLDGDERAPEIVLEAPIAHGGRRFHWRVRSVRVRRWGVAGSRLSLPGCGRFGLFGDGGLGGADLYL